MEIKKLVPIINGKINSGKIGMRDIFNTIPRFRLLFKNFPAARFLVLKDTKLNYHKNKASLEISGTSTWEDNLGIDLYLGIVKTKEGPQASVLVKLQGEHSLSIPGLDWFQLIDARIYLETVTMGNPYAKYTHGYTRELRCKLILDKHRIPLSAKYTNQSNIILAIGLKAISFKGLNDMAKLVGGTKQLSLPPQLDQLGAINLHKFELEIGPGLKKLNTLKRIAFGFGTAKSWKLIPKVFSLQKIDVFAELYDPLKKNRKFGGMISGVIAIGATTVIVEAIKGSGDDPWNFRARIPILKLSDLAEKVLNEFSIQAKLPKISFAETEVSITPSLGNYQLQSQTTQNSSWKIPLGKKTLEIKDLKFFVARNDGKMSGEIEGTATLFGTTITVKADFENQLNIKINIKNLSLLKIIKELLEDVNFPKEIPDVVFDTVDLSITPASKEFSLTASSTKDWKIPLGITGLVIEDIHFSASRKKATNKKFVNSGVFGGRANIGTVGMDLEYNFPGDFVFKTQVPTINLSPVIQDLCGTQAMMGISVPDSVTNIKLTDITISAAPKQKVFSLSGNCILGAAELIITKNKQKKWAFIAGFAPPSTWRFSALDNSLKPLDNLNLSNTALVLTTAPTRDTPLNIIQMPADVAIGKGLTFFSGLDLSDLGVKDLMDIDMLTISATIDTNPANLKLAAGIAGSFEISESVSMGNMNFFLKPAPSNFELGISGSVMAQLGDSDLTFIGTMGIRPIERSAAFAATMIGFWKEPFGIKGLQVGNVALELGIGIVPPPAVALPIVGIAGSIAVGTFEGSAAVKFDTANPNKSMIAASFNELYLNDVIQTFCDKKVYNKIPSEIRNTVLDVGMEDVGVYVVPQPTSIGELSYEQGFRFEGKLSIADFNAQFYFLLSYSEGFAIKASMDPIRIGNVFALEGSGKYPGPTLDVDLRLGGQPGVIIAGRARLLGLSVETLVTISDKGFLFFMEGKIFDVFVASLTVSGGNLNNGGDFYIKAVMRNDLISYLRKEARKGIQAAAKAATKEIEKAQKDVRNAQKEVNKIQKNIEDMRKTIRREREKSARGVRNAETAVRNAQKEVNKIQKNIEDMRRTIKRERDRDTKRLRTAQKEVGKAQKAVNSIQGEINKSKRRIDQLNGDIKRKKRWFDNSGWKKSFRWAEYSAYVAAKGTEITAVYAKIGGMEAAKGTAYGVLEAAKQVVRGIELAADNFPIDADVRIAGLFTAKGTATAGLEAAKQTLRLLQKTIKAFPIDADVRIVGLFTAKGAATAGLQTAIGILEVAKAAVGGLASVADFVVKHGLGGLFDVKQARFEGKLNALSGGSVQMGLSLILLSKPFHLSLAFNFKNVGATVNLLTKKLLDEIK